MAEKKQVTFQFESDQNLDEKWKEALNLYHGEGEVLKNEGKAFEMFLELAYRGHEPSMLELGCMYYMGCGVEKSFAYAKKWWKRLPSDPEALYGLGLVYYTGRDEEGLQPDHTKALRCWKHAAAGNNYNAVACLEKYFPEWDPGNETPSSIYKDSEPLLLSPIGKQRTLFMTSDTVSPLSPLKGVPFPFESAALRRRSSLVHELNLSSTDSQSDVSSRTNTLQSSENFRQGSINGYSENSIAIEKAIKDNNIRNSQINQTLKHVNSQLVDVQATVNVLNTQVFKDSAILQESIGAMREELSEIQTQISQGSIRAFPASNDPREVISLRTVVEGINDRVQELEEKINRSLMMQQDMKLILQELLDRKRL